MTEDLRRNVIRAIGVWLALLVLLALTAGTSFIALGTANTVLNFSISILKTLLIGAFFMHLSESSVVPRIICAIVIALLGIQLGLSGVDYATRISPVDHGGAPVAERRHGPSNGY